MGRVLEFVIMTALRGFCVFISAAFSDFEEERDVLRAYDGIWKSCVQIMEYHFSDGWPER